MSKEARDYVWDHAPIDDARRLLILLSLADVADENGGNAFPSVGRLARDSRCNSRTVQRHLAAMVADGTLTVDRPASQHRPTTYRIAAVQGRHSGIDRPLRGDTGVTSRASAPITKELELMAEQGQAPVQPNRPDPFDDFWQTYPRKVKKLAARKAWDKALKFAKPEAIIEGARRYRDDPQRSDQFTAHPTTWLNAGSWMDEASGPVRLAVEERGYGDWA